MQLELALIKKEKGISSSYSHANNTVANWGELALLEVIKFGKEHDSFLTEDVRHSLTDSFPLPPDGIFFAGFPVN